MKFNSPISVCSCDSAGLGMEGQVDFTKYWLNERHALESSY
jgi:hypothetical protein